jgi:hypothetical protein
VNYRRHAGCNSREARLRSSLAADSTKTAEGNIYNNKAVSYDIVFLDESDTVQCRGKLDKPEVKGNKRFYKFEKTEGKVPVMHTDAVGNIYTTSGKRVRLGIRPESAESAYPGDDLIPAFQAVYTSLSEGSIKYFDFQAKDSDYIAVYDKKLLWRANLYIEQKESALGNIDWNNAHPWTGEEGFGANEWNIPDAGYSGQSGGQVVSLPFFTWPGYANQSNANLDGEGILPRRSFQGSMVSYDYWGTDTPADFRTKLLQQKTFLGRLYNAQGVFLNNWANIGIPETSQQWGQTYAPTTSVTNYHNYVKVTDRPKQSQSDFPHQVTIEQQGQIGGYPYIPGFSFWYDHRNGGNNWDVSYAAAGLDCVAFVHRAIQASQA